MSAKDYGYEYTLDLCSAIERFTSSEEIKNPNAFVYRKSNLKYAIERAMYFQYINNEALYTLYSDAKNGKIPEKIIVHNHTEKSLLMFMTPLDTHTIKVKKESVIKTIIINFRRYVILATCIDKISRAIRLAMNTRRQRGKKFDVLFSVDRERFVRYLEPIASIVPETSRWAYITYDQNAINYLQSKNLPYISSWNTLYFLERWAKKRDLMYKFVIYDKFDFLADSVQRIHPKSTVVVEGNAPHDEITNVICQKEGVASMCIQQGWSPIVHTGFRNMHYSKMLMWGQGFADLLKKDNPRQQFVVTGSHNIRIAPPQEVKAEKIILTFFIQDKSRLLSEEGLLGFVDLIQWISLNCPNISMVIAGKGGPQIYEHVKDVKHVETVKDPNKMSLQSILDMGNIIVSAYSTVILESIAVGKLPIIVNITPMPHFYPDIHAVGAGIEVKNIEETKEIIKKIDEGKIIPEQYYPKMKQFTEKFFSFNTDTAIKNIIKEII